MFAVKPGPTFDYARRSYANELAQWESIIEELVDLFLRVNPQEAELAATVHFAARTLPRTTVKNQPKGKCLMRSCSGSS
jgi:hypothetical protein